MNRTRKERRRKERNRRKKSKILISIAFIFLVGLFILIYKVYDDISQTTDSMYTEITDQEEVREEKVNIDAAEDPFSVLLLGIDTGVVGRDYKGRSDTVMVLTVNPNDQQSTIVSIPRDTYTEMIGRETMDKINHAYAFGGPSMAINSVQNLLDIPLDYFVEMNMQGIKDLIDAIGGIEVTPTLTFSYEGYDFTEGVSETLTGDAALEYSRMRKDDPEGDYGRQERQRQIIEAAINKVTTFSTITNYQSVLSTLETNMATNLSFADMVDIFNKYRHAAETIEHEQMSGYGETIQGVYYEIIPDEELARISEILKEQLEMET